MYFNTQTWMELHVHKFKVQHILTGELSMNIKIKWFTVSWNKKINKKTEWVYKNHAEHSEKFCCSGNNTFVYHLHACDKKISWHACWVQIEFSP